MIYINYFILLILVILCDYIVLSISKSLSSIQVSNKPELIKIVTNEISCKEALRKHEFCSGIILLHEHVGSLQSSCCQLSENTLTLLNQPTLLPNFDNDQITLNLDSDLSNTNSVVDSLLPKELSTDEWLKDNLASTIDLFRNVKYISKESNPTVICRLALMSSVRCPKWHEDYVNLRLIKTYYGKGTEWTLPDDSSIRFNNWIRSHIDLDLTVSNDKIQRLDTGDAFIMSGRYHVDKYGEKVVPILHRSPPDYSEVDHRRLLFTITLP